jgi:hypothetical protein
MSMELPRPDFSYDDQLLKLCDTAVSTVEGAINAMLDQHHRDLSLPALSLLNEAVQKVRMAARQLKEP